LAAGEHWSRLRKRLFQNSDGFDLDEEILAGKGGNCDPFRYFLGMRITYGKTISSCGDC